MAGSSKKQLSLLTLFQVLLIVAALVGSITSITSHSVQSFRVDQFPQTDDALIQWLEEDQPNSKAQVRRIEGGIEIERQSGWTSAWTVTSGEIPFSKFGYVNALPHQTRLNSRSNYWPLAVFAVLFVSLSIYKSSVAKQPEEASVASKEPKTNVDQDGDA